MSFHLSTLCAGLALSLAACTFVPAAPSAITLDDGITIDCEGTAQLCGPHMPPPPPPPSSPALVPPVV